MTEQSKTPNTGIATCGLCGQEMHPTDYLPRIKDENAALREDAERYRFLRDSQDRATESDWPAIYQDDRCALTGETADEIIDSFRQKDAARKEQP